MPGYDGTGPQGVGPEGRRMGPCSSDTEFPRRGFWGFRRGRRGGVRGFWWPRRYVADQAAELKSEKDWLTKQLDFVNQRLSEIDEN